MINPTSYKFQFSKSKLHNNWSPKEQIKRQNSYEHLSDATKEVELNDDTSVSQKKLNPDKKKTKQQIGCGDKLIVLDSGNETWL